MDEANPTMSRGVYSDDQGIYMGAGGGGGGGFPEDCRLYHTANQPIVQGVVTPLAFNSEYRDPTGMHDTVINNTRITIATPGHYIFGGNITWASGNGGGTVRQVLIRLNGSPYLAANMFQAGAQGSFRININVPYECVATDYVELCAHHFDAVSPLNVDAELVNGLYLSPLFWAIRVR